MMGTPLAQARENSIEIYDENLGRHTVLTRSARMRKFKFYQYKPVHESPTSAKDSSMTSYRNDRLSLTTSGTDRNNTDSMLLTRDNVLQGKVALIPEQSKELLEVDKRIADIEKKISSLNESANKDSDNMDEIFSLVNEKNDLLRLQMQLNIIEQERSLEKANEELTKELRSLMSIEDSKKTETQLERQQHLYNQSLALVNKRNELVHHMDVQERCIEDDNELKATLKNVTRGKPRSSSQDQNCVIQ